MGDQDDDDGSNSSLEKSGFGSAQENENTHTHTRGRERERAQFGYVRRQRLVSVWMLWCGEDAAKMPSSGSERARKSGGTRRAWCMCLLASKPLCSDSSPAAYRDSTVSESSSQCCTVR